MFVIKKLRSGELEFRLTFSPWQKLVDFFIKLDLLLSRKIVYLLPVGLGIGFGVSLVVFSQPAGIFAGHLQNEPSLKPLEIIFSGQKQKYFPSYQGSLNLIATTWSNETVFFPNFINQNDQFIIGSTQFTNLDLKLGNSLQILASNQGLYTFHIYQIREIKSQDINQLKAELEAKLIILQPQNWLGTLVNVILAK